jgi:non-specific serine/threonine protein kinase/serine/threonine-protein kinase
MSEKPPGNPDDERTADPEHPTESFVAGAQVDAARRQRVGPYRLLHALGSGGMGTVYLALRDDEQFHKRVAVKLLRREAHDEELLQRFRRERQILASLDHDHIARLLDGGTTEDGFPYLVMEYVEGLPIDRWCDTHSLSVRERLLLFRSVCSAVHFAHQSLVVHRDLKPANILVTAQGVPKLLDFGIAKLLNPHLAPEAHLATQVEARVMTPEYASPEQIRGEPVTTASDVYSLGVLLYELLTGHRPIRLASRNLTEIARAVSEEEPTRPSTVIEREVETPRGDGTTRRLTPDSVSRTREGSPERLRRRLAGDLDNIVLMALRKEPKRRYASAEALSDDIRRHLEGLPVAARPDTLGYRLERFVFRHRLAVGAAAAVVLALVVGLVAATAQARVARAQRARAEAALADVRKLANAFIFEVHDAIEPLPGATPARETVVRLALEYLDRLAASTPTDASLQLELAAAYSRIGTIQWNRYQANLGQLDAAFASQEKALAIRERVAAAEPGNREARRVLARSLVLVGDLLAEREALEEALARYRRSLELRERLVAEDPKDVPARKDLAVSHERIGDTLGNPGFPNLGDTAGALESFERMQGIVERVAAENPQDRDARHRVAVGYEKLGKVKAAAGDVRGALELFRREADGLGALAAEEPANAAYRRNLAVAYGNVGSALFDLGELRGALEVQRHMLGIRDELAAADARNRAARRDLAWAHDVIGDTQAALRDDPAAVASYRRAAALLDELLRADPAQISHRERLASTLESLASALARLGREGEAREAASRARALRKAATFASSGR